MMPCRTNNIRGNNNNPSLRLASSYNIYPAVLNCCTCTRVVQPRWPVLTILLLFEVRYQWRVVRCVLLVVVLLVDRGTNGVVGLPCYQVRRAPGLEGEYILQYSAWQIPVRHDATTTCVIPRCDTGSPLHTQHVRHLFCRANRKMERNTVIFGQIRVVRFRNDQQPGDEWTWIWGG